ncbi:FAD-dependent monooxygenase [Kutzneria albida]|uniref:FAD-binding domain-containing protein n=1 Tax=Kutzneria albida DSM 43870 TaxID=1449976 RepID=W5WAR9_9PSEU|nr:FAD-dependent monooxygenase [Kutzneria albida]AHH95304.1 hypothetical protein KALB_1934 [Kutzneria albida DSM 43870]
MKRTAVLIVGGGPVGLTLSILLKWHGVDHVLLEAREQPSAHPKARGVAASSMETFRRCGLEAEIRAAGLPASSVHFYRGRSLVDPDYTRTGTTPTEQRNTPSPGLVCAQDALEPILRRHAEGWFGARLAEFSEHRTGLRAVLTDGRRLEADWLVGCDGAASGVRAAAGIEMVGPTGLGRYLSVRFEAPLGEVVADRASASYFLTPPAVGGFLAVDNDRHWIYQYPLGPEPGDLVELVRGAAGIPDLPVTIRDTMTWRMDAQLAAAYRRGRVLLAGDAAHTIPPTGGHGMNTGIGDVANLAWRLAAVTSGWAEPALLEGYEAERRPIARQVIDISLANSRARGGYRIDDELLLGAVYGEQPRLPTEGYVPTVQVGHRAPHVWLGGGVSTVDKIGPGFTEIPYGDKTVLVRPDGYIAWCSTGPTTTKELRQVVAQLLSS